MRRQTLLTIWIASILALTGVVGPDAASANPEGGFSLWVQRAYNAARQGHLSRGAANIRFPEIIARWFTGGVPEEQIVHVGDLDGDGVLEQVGIDGGRVVALRPDLSVAWTSDLILAERIWDIIDLDGDRVGEVLVSGDGSMFVLGGADGAVQFTFGFTEPTLEIEDLDGDGSLEILVRNARENPGLRAYTFAGGVEAGALAWQTLTNIPDGPFDLAVGDVDGNGQTFEVLLDDRDGGRIVVLAGDGGRLLRQGTERVIQGDLGCGPSLVANLDGDEQQEFIYSGADVGPRTSAFIAAYDFADDEIQWSYEFGNNNASSALRLPLGAVADLNGDGQPELVASVFNNTREVTSGQPADLDGVFQPGVWSLVVYDGDTGEMVDFRANLVASAVVALDAEGSLAILAQTAGRSIETGAPGSGIEALVLSEGGELETLWTLPRAALLSRPHERLTTCSPGDGLAPAAIADVTNDGHPEALVARHLDDDGDPDVLQLVSLDLQLPRVRAERDLASHHRPLVHDMGRGMLPDKAHLAVQLGDGFLTIFDEQLLVQSRSPLTRHLAEPRVVNGFVDDAEFRRVLIQERTSELVLLDVAGPGLRPSPVWIGEFEEIPQPMVAVRADGGSSRIVHLTRDDQGNPLIEALDALGAVRWSRALPGSRTLPTSFISGKFDLNDGDELIYVAHDDRAGARLEMVDGGTGEVRQTRLLNEIDGIDDTAQVIMIDFGDEVAPDFLVVDGDSAFMLDGDLTPVAEIAIGIEARFSTAADFSGSGGVEIFSNAGVDRKALLDVDGAVVWEILIEGDDHTWRDDVQTWPGVVDTDAGPGLEIAVAGRTGDLTLLNGATGEVVWRVCLSGGEALLMPDGAPRVGQCEGARLSDITSGNIITDSQDPGLERQELAFGAEDGWLYVLEAESGAVAWAMDLGAPVGAPLLTDPLLTDTLSLVVPVANGDVYTIQSQFPPVAEVRDVAAEGNRVLNRDIDEDELEATDGLGVAWEPIQGANGYKVAILSDDGRVAQALTDVGPRTDAVITDLDLEIGRTYRALVVAYDAQQRDGAVTSSDGLRLSDLTDPEIVSIASSVESFNPSRDPDVRLTGEATDNLGLASLTFEARREGEGEAIWTERFDPEAALSFQAVAAWDGRTDADEAAPDGLYEVTLTATDLGDNVASASVQILLDATAPDAPVIVDPVDGALLLVAQITIQGRAEAGALVEVDLDGEVACTAEATEAGTFECTPDDLTEGEHVVTAKATDALGNVSEPATPVTFAVDLLPPAAPVITTPEDGEVFETASPTFEGEAEIDAEVGVELVGVGVVCTTRADAQGRFACAPVAGIAEGQHEVFARATDRAGRISEPSVSVKFSIAGDEPEPEGTPEAEPEGTPEVEPEGNPEGDPAPIVTASPADDCACSTPARPTRAPWAPLAFAALGLALLLRRRA